MQADKPRPYHHGNLARALVEAGLEMAAEGGPEAIVLREVARRVGVSPTAAYRHFAGQADLADAVKEAALMRLADHLTSALDAFDEHGAAGRGGTTGFGQALVELRGVEAGSAAERALRRLEVVGRAYFDFAVTQPGLFRSFCIGLPVSGDSASRATLLDSPEALRQEAPALAVLAAVLDELVDAGVLTTERRASGVNIALWAAVHGLAVLCLDGPLAELPRDQQEAMLTRVADVAMHGLAGVR